MARPQQEIPTAALRGTKSWTMGVPANIKGASEDPKNPSNQSAPKGASGRWATRHEELFGRSPVLDASGKSKFGGTRPSKTAWARSGKKDQVAEAA